jgi:hypothetical protein
MKQGILLNFNTISRQMFVRQLTDSYDMSVSKVPYFLNYFVQQSPLPGDIDVAPAERKTFHSHVFGNDTVIFILDR